MSNIFKNGGGAGIGSYVIVFKDGQLAPDTDPLKLWGAYESGEQIYISVIDEETQDALVPASGWIDADSKLHLVARDFDDDKTYSVVLEYAPIASEMHIEGNVEEGIEGGGVSKEEVEEMIADKADLVNGKVPAEQLPSYVDDILEFPTLDDFPNPGEEGKIYVALDTNYTYRWAGSVYTQVGGSEVDLSDYYRKEEVNELLDEKADVALRIPLIVDEETELKITGHIDNKDAALLLENPERPVRFQLNGILISPQTKLVDNGLEYNAMTGGPDSTSYLNVIVSEESNSWELTTVYGIETLTNGLVEAKNNINELQDNVGALGRDVAELQQALPATVPAIGATQELTNEILGHGVFEQNPPTEEGPIDTNSYCIYYNSDNEPVWRLILNRQVYNKFLSTLPETIPSYIAIRNGNNNVDWTHLQLTDFKSKSTVQETGPIKVVNTYVYNGIIADYFAGIQYSVSLRLVSDNGASLSSDIISTPILKPSQVENLVQSAIGDVLNTDF